MSKGPTTKRPKLNWPQIRAQFEAGDSASALGKAHGCSHTAILKRAKAEGWTQEAEAVIQRRVSEKVSGVVSDELPIKRAAAIDAEATRRAEIIRRHREEPNAIRAVMYEGLGRHRQATQPKKDGEQLNDKERAELRAAAFDTLKAAKIASETLINLHRVERKAWGLDSTENDTPDTRAAINSFHCWIDAQRVARSA